VLSVRNRLASAKASANLRMSSDTGIAEAWWTMTSGLSQVALLVVPAMSSPGRAAPGSAGSDRAGGSDGQDSHLLPALERRGCEADYP
jgi:hypothetical protein